MRMRSVLVALIAIGALAIPIPANAYPIDWGPFSFLHFILGGGDQATQSAGQEKGLRLKITLKESSEYPNIEAPWCIKNRMVYADRYNPKTEKWAQAGSDKTDKDGLAKIDMKDRTGRYRARVIETPPPEGEEIGCWKKTKLLGKHKHN